MAKIMKHANTFIRNAKHVPHWTSCSSQVIAQDYGSPLNWAATTL